MIISWLARNRDIEDVEPDIPVWVNVIAFDREWAKNTTEYIGTGFTNPGNAAEYKYKRFGEFIRAHQSIEIHMPEINVSEEGLVEFSDGRHRLAWLRDQGVKSLPVAAMDSESAAILENWCGTNDRVSILDLVP